MAVTAKHKKKLVAIGSRIVEARGDLSLRDVYRLTVKQDPDGKGVFKASICRIEHGVRDGKPCGAKVATLYKIARALGKHPSQFFATIVTAPPLQGEARMDSLVRDNIIRLRIAANLTRRELGHKIGSSQDVISRIEEPDHERKLLPTTLTLMRIADGLDVDLVKFFLPEKGYRYRDPV